MRILFDDKDEKYMENITKHIEDGNLQDIPLLASETGRIYHISFEVTDIAKANAFLNAFIFNDAIFKEDSGIKPNAIHFTDPKYNIIEILENTIEQLKRSE